ncbi:MAG: type II toxin-antitoxin system HipA family toxin [Deltaproteobacteria bacterium]|nr:MAG: type II toxin-antitoxin system HipA family toxin [Deltaproteobacteria bacterium]
MKNKSEQKEIFVYTDWETFNKPLYMGILRTTPLRGKEVFSFEYDRDWLKSGYATHLDPELKLFTGPQYPQSGHKNFGLFLDSSPDRWGRLLMRRREEQLAREEKRNIQTLMESDYLLGVFDQHRMGALRFKLNPSRPFLDDNREMASPPWTQLRELENASLQLEKDHAEKNKDYMKWLKLLIAPGGSLGGARPKASVIDTKENLWIAKFPSKNDELNIGAWEFLVHQLAVKAKITMSESQIKRFSGLHDTFLTKRFDRHQHKRIHFASAMTLLNRNDGEDSDEGVSYLDLVDFLIQNGCQAESDLEQLWRRIIFNICISNTDDHLRNHGFLLTEKGWKLAPAYDINPSETGDGLKLNISKDDNTQSLDLALSVAVYFRLKQSEAKKIISEIIKSVLQWRNLAKKLVPSKEIFRMEHAFRVVEEQS